MTKTGGWKSEPISCVCTLLQWSEQHHGGKECGNPTVKVYPAMGRGWQSLCAKHAKKHEGVFDVYEVIKDGEKWV